MATKHAGLYERFIALEKRMAQAEHPEPDDLSKIRKEVLAIEVDEPSIFLAVNRLCHNQVLRAEGFGNDSDWIEPLGLYHRILKNLIRFNELPSRKAS